MNERRQAILQREACDGTGIEGCKAITRAIRVGSETRLKTQILGKVVCTAANGAEVHGRVLGSIDVCVGCKVRETKKNIGSRRINRLRWRGRIRYSRARRGGSILSHQCRSQPQYANSGYP